MSFRFFGILLLTAGCSHYEATASEILIPQSNLICEKACHLMAKIQSQDYEMEKEASREIRDSFARIIKFPENEELSRFTTLFFKELDLSESLNKESLSLPADPRYALPNTNALKFFYRAERELNRAIDTMRPFTSSTNKQVQNCAREAELLFQSQRDFFASIRDIDYRELSTSDIPDKIPSEVLRAHAKLLEQQDRTFREFNTFFSYLADLSSP
ncbi:MAG TPA: hypothetical protein VLE89_05900 [Chlamydiales bacterium]|nr:hypothetical protein [Chlamydiales bacterium]